MLMAAVKACVVGGAGGHRIPSRQLIHPYASACPLSSPEVIAGLRLSCRVVSVTVHSTARTLR